MAFSLGTSFQLHEQALYIQARRAQLLAANLANADTPNYKALDINFNQALQKAAGTSQSVTRSVDNLRRTHQKHISSKSLPAGMEPLFRVPRQASLDGNTVEAEAEMSAFNDNSIRYVASLRFINSKINGLMTALRGE